MRHILDTSAADLKAWLTERGQAEYRARQILRWASVDRVGSFDEMLSLPRTLRGESVS